MKNKKRHNRQRKYPAPQPTAPQAKTRTDNRPGYAPAGPLIRTSTGQGVPASGVWAACGMTPPPAYVPPAKPAQPPQLPEGSYVGTVLRSHSSDGVEFPVGGIITPTTLRFSANPAPDYNPLLDYS